MTQRVIEILASEKNPVAWLVKCVRLMELWGEIVDERVGKQTEPLRLKNKILYVATTSSTWAQELTFLKKEIIKKFNIRAGEEAIKDIRFLAKGDKISGRV